MPYLAFEHGGDIYDAERRSGRPIIDFSANINPLGLPPGLKKAVRNHIKSILHYPDPEARDVKSRIARHLDVGEDNIILGNGSIELIYLIASAHKPKTVLVAAPDFSEYERAARAARSRVKYLKLREGDNFKLDTNRLGDPDMLFFSNPNNPTGRVVLEEHRSLSRFPGGLIIADEAFMDFVPGHDAFSLAKIAPRTKNIIVLRTLTKFFAMPGLRLGYAVAHKDTIRLLRRHQAPWSVNALAQEAAKAVLDDKGYMNNARSFVERERGFLSGELDRIEGLRPLPSVANFVLVKIERKNMASRHLRERLLAKGILVRDCGNFRGLNGQFIRVAVRKRRENIRLIESLRLALKI